MSLSILNLNDEGYYTIVCQNGHQTNTIIWQPKYELLFELGMNAIADGYLREGVTAFASSLERFRETCFRFILHLADVDHSFVDESWKRNFVRWSERQYGGFHAVWLVTIKGAPKTITPKQTELRNKVVHQGYIPTLAETKSYGEAAAHEIEENFRTLVATYGSKVDEFLRHEFSGRAMMKNVDISTLSIPTIIGTRLQSQNSIEFDDWIEKIRKDRVIFDWPKP
ncbi:hypothetical protein [Wenxinia saemankumensis]|nr:hypothetical protein [Wenxinia saemankumensis]